MKLAIVPFPNNPRAVIHSNHVMITAHGPVAFRFIDIFLKKFIVVYSRMKLIIFFT